MKKVLYLGFIVLQFVFVFSEQESCAALSVDEQKQCFNDSKTVEPGGTESSFVVKSIFYPDGTIELFCPDGIRKRFCKNKALVVIFPDGLSCEKTGSVWKCSNGVEATQYKDGSVIYKYFGGQIVKKYKKNFLEEKIEEEIRNSLQKESRYNRFY